jgi:DNA topoisomerase II
MHLYTAAGSVRRYHSATDVIRDHFEARLEGYSRRKECMMVALERRERSTADRVRFLEAVLSGELDLQRTQRAELVAAMSAMGLARNGETEPPFDHLLRMPLYSLTPERRDELIVQLAALRGEMDALRAATPASLWSQDLDALEAEYNAYEAARLAALDSSAGDLAERGSRRTASTTRKRRRPPVAL